MTLLDTRPASFSSEDVSDDIIPPAPKGRPKNGAPKGRPTNGAEPLESGDESSGPASEHISGDESSSDEDLTVMNPKVIQRKLTSEVKCVYY